MTEAKFWSLFDSLPPNGRGAHLCQCLEMLYPNEILEFNVFLRREMSKACQLKLLLANYVVRGYVSDDEFQEFRAWLVSQGKSRFCSALEDADSIAQWIDVSSLESFDGVDILMAANCAYTRAGTEDEFYSYMAEHGVYELDPLLPRLPDELEGAILSELPQLSRKVVDLG